jgi:two-component sensor histidine kinase
MIMPAKGLRFFFIVTFLAVIVFPFVNFYYIFPLFSNVVVHNAEKDAILLANHLADIVFGKKGEPPDTQIARETISREVRDFKLWKLRVYDRNGKVLLSSVPSEKGERMHEDFFLPGGKKKTAFSELIRKNDHTIEGETVSRDVLETMVPVYGPDGLRGAFEIYYDVTGQLGVLNSAVTKSAVVLLGFVLVIFIAVLVFLTRIDKDNSGSGLAPPGAPLTRQSPYYLFLVLIISVFSAEVVVMMLLSVFPNLAKSTSVLLDALLLVLFVSPALYLFLLRPLIGNIQVLNVTEDKLRRSLGEKEVLIKEIHHRVKNNLQVISSLLGLQSRRVEDPAARSVLLESEGRIHSMAMIHEMLYATENLSTLKFSSFVRDLAARVMRYYQGENGRVTLKLDIPDVHFNVDTLIPCGLILNELLSNAFKYAFPDGREGTLDISLTDMGQGNYALTVKDDGVGLPDGLDIWSARSLGFQIVRSMAAKLDGTLEVKSSDGSEFRVNFTDKAGGL